MKILLKEPLILESQYIKNMSRITVFHERTTKYYDIKFQLKKKHVLYTLGYTIKLFNYCTILIPRNHHHKLLMGI